MTRSATKKARPPTEAHHVLEVSLGMGPYEYLGRHRPAPANQSVFSTAGENKCTGSCDHCGTAIVEQFHVRNAAGQVFKLGSDCIFKIGLSPENKSSVEYDVKMHRRDLAFRRKVKKYQAWDAQFDAIKDSLRKKPHPHAGMAARGATLADYVAWCLEQGYAAKELKLILGQG